MVDFGAGIGYYGMYFQRRKASPFHMEKKQTELYMQKFLENFGNDSTRLDIHQEVYSWHGKFS